MEDGGIQDSQITSSGYHSHSLYHGPTNARLNEVPQAGRTVGAWIAKKNDKNQWIQVAFGETVHVTGVMIQGRGAGSEHYVTKFKVLYSDDSVNWNYVQTADNQSDKVSHNDPQVRNNISGFNRCEKTSRVVNFIKF